MWNEKEYDDYGTYWSTEGGKGKHRSLPVDWKGVVRPFYDKGSDQSGKFWYVNDVKYRLYYWHLCSDRITNDPNYLGFRNGPMPRISAYKGGWWHKYRGNHNTSPKTEYTVNVTHEKDAVEYGVVIKIRKKRAALVKLFTIDYDYPYSSSRGRWGWKRSRKAKQWM